MMDSEAKSALSSTIRDLRDRMLEDFHDAVESEYRLSLQEHDADLPPQRERGRAQLTARIEERVRARRSDKKASETEEEARQRMRREIEKEAAYTLLNRLVVLRLMEEAGLSSPTVVDGGWDSSGYREFREWAPALCDDDTEGYRTLLDFVFDDIARELPGLFGEAGAAELVPVPADTLRHAVEALNDRSLDACWEDDTTLGWVYQFWNDPDRKELDAKINDGGKIEPQEIAQKTQLFTERYMVEWLLQNSLGSKWLAICEKNGWIPECGADDDFAIWRNGLPGDVEHTDEVREATDSKSDESAEAEDIPSMEDNEEEERRKRAIEQLAAGDGPSSLLQKLAVRRADWREKREAGEVEADAMMSVEGDAEDRWKYWVPREMPDDAPEDAPGSITELELLDPACGSGHFLVIAFDLLVPMYREEARRRGEEWSEREIVESIVENNLYGIDIDPRVAQIAAAALYLKSKAACEEATPKRLNVVAPDLKVANLPADDPAVVEFREAITEETHLSGEVVEQILDALSEAYHLGTLLKIEEVVDEALVSQLGWEESPPTDEQTSVFSMDGWKKRVEETKVTVMDELRGFLARHSSSDDLGLRLHGQQFANGVRFLSFNRTGRFDVVTGNPPYQGASKMEQTQYLDDHYDVGKPDLYSAFLMRGADLVRPGGVCGLVTKRNWMFINSFSDFG